jgi:RNA polymerase sigma-70 factor (ECF subfamily)
VPLAVFPKSSARAAAVPPSEADWSGFYDAHFEFVWRSLRRLGVREANLDDAAQEVFLIVFRRQDAFEHRSSSKTWLYGIAFFVARRFARASARDASAPIPEELPDTREPTPHEVVARAQSVRLVHAALDLLEAEKRAVFVLAELEQLSAVEIAEVIGAPLNTVYSRLRAARRDFDGALRRIEARTPRRSL